MPHLFGPVYKFVMAWLKHGICKIPKIQNEELLAIVIKMHLNSDYVFLKTISKRTSEADLELLQHPRWSSLR